jgi:hypothetical protein
MMILREWKLQQLELVKKLKAFRDYLGDLK